MSTPAKLPPTADALLRALGENDGSLNYRDPRVTTSGLTGLRHRGLVRVFSAQEHPSSAACVVLTEAGRVFVAAGDDALLVSMIQAWFRAGGVVPPSVEPSYVTEPEWLRIRMRGLRAGQIAAETDADRAAIEAAK